MHPVSLRVDAVVDCAHIHTQVRQRGLVCNHLLPVQCLCARTLFALFCALSLRIVVVVTIVEATVGRIVDQIHDK